jgi:CheY-specific phosphatase CheX
VSLKKYAVLLDQPEGPLTALVPRLKELDFRVFSVPDANAALELIRAFPKLCLVAVREALDPPSARDLVGKLRETQPLLPLLWIGEDRDLATGRPAELFFSECPPADDLNQHVEHLLCRRSYPEHIVKALGDAAACCLGSFGAHTALGDPFLKASKTRLADLSAMISFTGDVTGHLVTSCSTGVAREACRRLFRSTTEYGEDDLADFLGELCNCTLGRLTQHFERYERSLTFGLPFYITGAGSVLWEESQRPSLALELEILGGRLFVELSVKDFEPPTTQPKAVNDLLQSGQCILL